MLAAFSRQLEAHQIEVRRIMHEQAQHVDNVLERLQSLVVENEALRQENARLEALLAGLVDHDHDSERPSVAIKILQAARSEHPSSFGALLKPTTSAGVIRLFFAAVGGLGIGALLVLWRYLVK